MGWGYKLWYNFCVGKGIVLRRVPEAFTPGQGFNHLISWGSRCLWRWHFQTMKHHLYMHTMRPDDWIILGVNGKCLIRLLKLWTVLVRWNGGSKGACSIKTLIINDVSAVDIIGILYSHSPPPTHTLTLIMHWVLESVTHIYSSWEYGIDCRMDETTKLIREKSLQSSCIRNFQCIKVKPFQ